MISETKPVFPENADFLKLIKEYSEELGTLQREARALNIPLIIVFEGRYDVFIGEIINRQLLPLDPRGFDFYFTGAPTSEESKIPFIFRFSRKIPPKGKIAVFDRSWYTRGLIERLLSSSKKTSCFSSTNKTNLESILEKPIDKEVANAPEFERFVKTINNFEKTLFDDGTRFIKIYIDSKDKTAKSQENWKDIIPYYVDKKAMEKIYKKNIHVIKELLEQTNTGYAPWNLYFVGKNIDEATAGTMKIIIDQMKQIIFDAKLKQIQKAQAQKTPKAPETEMKLNQNETEYSIVEGPLDLVDFSKSYTKREYEKKLKKYQKKLSFAHYALYMNKKPMVLIFEGWDAAGKGSSIKRVVQAMNPRYYHVIPIGTPTDADHKYHYLWRFLEGIPPCGKTSIYDRSWYGRVLVERIEQLITKEEWSRAYDEINHFEKAMTNDGMIIIKFWMHISKEKQYERFTARSLNPQKQWKLTEEDWRNREKWDQYYDAVNEMILKTDIEEAPWVIVEANDKYYARIKVLKTIIERIEKELDKEMKEVDLLSR